MKINSAIDLPGSSAITSDVARLATIEASDLVIFHYPIYAGSCSRSPVSHVPLSFCLVLNRAQLPASLPCKQLCTALEKLASESSLPHNVLSSPSPALIGNRTNMDVAEFRRRDLTFYYQASDVILTVTSELVALASSLITMMKNHALRQGREVSNKVSTAGRLLHLSPRCRMMKCAVCAQQDCTSGKFKNAQA